LNKANYETFSCLSLRIVHHIVNAAVVQGNKICILRIT